MLYEKPNLKYTEMAMFVDEHAYKEDNSLETEGLIYEYIYHIVFMLAHKLKYFNETKYYEEFAIFGANRVYLRLKNSKQFENPPGMKKLNSVLNYIKSSLPFIKIDFQQENFSQVISISDITEEFDTNYSLSENLMNSLDEIRVVEFDCCLGDICKTAKKFLSKIPYKTNTKEWKNIYTSCLLTFLNSITLSNKDISRIKSCNNVLSLNNLIDNIYKKEKYNSVILYHLDDNMYNYIDVLTRCLKHEIAKDLSYTSHNYISSDSGLKSLIYSEITNDSSYEFEED